MMKNDTTVASTLNTKGWKYFTISKLFSITSPASRSIKKYEEGEIPYGFADMCTQKVLKKENIILPIDKDKKPNWKYMEDYMKELEKLAHNKIEGLLAAEVCMR